jgi:hypothetical protein
MLQVAQARFIGKDNVCKVDMPDGSQCGKPLARNQVMCPGHRAYGMRKPGNMGPQEWEEEKQRRRAERELWSAARLKRASEAAETMIREKKLRRIDVPVVPPQVRRQGQVRMAVQQQQQQQPTFVQQQPTFVQQQPTFVQQQAASAFVQQVPFAQQQPTEQRLPPGSPSDLVQRLVISQPATHCAAAACGHALLLGGQHNVVCPFCQVVFHDYAECVGEHKVRAVASSSMSHRDHHQHLAVPVLSASLPIVCRLLLLLMW